VKKSLDITLTTIHLGSERRVVTLMIGDDHSITTFLEDLERENQKAFKQLKAAIRVLSENRHYQNEYKFKNLRDGLYEIKTNSGARVYAFLDDHDGSHQQLVIAASGGGKGKQDSDIEKARAIRRNYLVLRDKGNVVPTLQLLPDES
jgi:putative component of toxin-antitoxin plasmid stabilization module